MTDTNDTHDAIESLLAELRTFPPPSPFRRDALVADAEIYADAEPDHEALLGRQAAELLDWFEARNTILEWNLPFATWFVGGTSTRVQLPRPPRRRRPRRPGRIPLGGRARRRACDHLQVLLAAVRGLANTLRALGVAR